MKKKPEIKFKCGECGQYPELDKEKSNSNWSVYPAKCSKCGGKMIIDFI